MCIREERDNMVSTIGRNTWYLNSFTGVVIYINDVIMFYIYSQQNKKREDCFASNPELDKQSDFDL